MLLGPCAPVRGLPRAARPCPACRLSHILTRTLNPNPNPKPYPNPNQECRSGHRHEPDAARTNSGAVTRRDSKEGTAASEPSSPALAPATLGPAGAASPGSAASSPRRPL